MIWDLMSDCPVAQVYSGNVGDDYPSIRINKDKGSILAVAEPYMKQITYWTIPKEVAEKFAVELTKRWNEYKQLKAAIVEQNGAFGDVLELLAQSVTTNQITDMYKFHDAKAVHGKYKENINATTKTKKG